jgi:hypothetical protein
MADLPEPRTLWQRLVLWPIQQFYMWTGQRLVNMPPLPSYKDVLARIAPRPLLLISTGRGLEQALGRRYLGWALEPKLLWELPEARHASGWLARPQVYEQTMLRFFNRYLRLDMQSAQWDTDTAVLPTEPQNELEDATLSFLMANVVSLISIPLAYGLFFWPYTQLWKRPLLSQQITITAPLLVAFVMVFIGSVILHEALHAVGYVWLGKARRDEIKFGFSWRGLAPYAHCKKAMPVRAYRWSVLLPGLLLGVLPGVLGLLTGAGWLIVYGGLMLVAAGGDTAVLLAIRHIPGNVLVLDHPSKVGCQIINN